MTHADRDASEAAKYTIRLELRANQTAQPPASDATCPPDATETPADTRAGVDTAEDHTEAQSMLTRRETDAGGMDNQGAELDRLRAQVKVAEYSVSQWQASYLSAVDHSRELQARAEAAEAKVARVEALHVKDGDFCAEDGFGWPCRTRRALAGDA